MSDLKKILYVEDEEDIRTIAQIALEDIGKFEVLFCGSGKEALDKVDSFSPDLLLLDVMMPGMDGPTTLKEIRKKPGFKDIPAMFMTAKAQTSEINDYLQLGILDVIVKPFDPMNLAETIQQSWEKKRG